MKAIRSLLLVAFALVAGPVLADTPINQTHALAADGHLSVSNVAGAVIVHTWSKNRVGITGTLGSGSRIEISGNADDLTIKIKQKDKDSGWFSHTDMGPTTLELKVPAHVSLDVDTVSARITADGLAGGKLDLDTVSGNIRLDTDNPDVTINSVSGDIELSGSTAKLDVNTVSGDVRVDKVGSKASAQTVSGDVRMHGGPFRDVSVETVSGDITLAGAMDHEVNAKLHSMSGDIRLIIDGSMQPDLDVSSFSGDIHSALGEVTTPTHGPGSSLHFKSGQGGDITLDSFSGDIDIRKQH